MIIKSNNVINPNLFDELLSEKNGSQNTTVKIKKIDRHLDSGKINAILRDNIFNESIFGKQKIYNAIYTERFEECKKNTGCCYIDFTDKKFIVFLIKNMKYLNKKNNCEFSWSELQGEEFLCNMNIKKAYQTSLDYIIFK